jgi:hypothetical protein
MPGVLKAAPLCGTAARPAAPGVRSLRAGPDAAGRTPVEQHQDDDKNIPPVPERPPRRQLSRLQTQRQERPRRR